VALVHTDQESEECSRERSVLQGVERNPMEPHRAPLGGEGHATEALAALLHVEVRIE